MNHIELFDVTIIGGGPAGLYSAFYSGLRNLKTKIIESQSQLGGKLQLYPEKIVWDVGGISPTSGEQLRKQLVTQGKTFDPTVVLNEKVTHFFKNENGTFTIQTATGDCHFSKTIIIAIGSGTITPQKLHIEGADRFEVSNLHYTVKSLNRFKDKSVVISGGGNSAVDWASMLAPIAKKVSIICRKEGMSGHEAQVSQLQQSSVDFYMSSAIQTLIASEAQDTIEKLEIIDLQTQEKKILAVDEVLINHGYDIDATLLTDSQLPLTLTAQQTIKGNARSETSISGIFAAGDILHHDGKVQLMAGAFQDAVNAVNQAKQWVDPKATASAMVSSHHDAFQIRNKSWIQQMVENKEK